MARTCARTSAPPVLRGQHRQALGRLRGGFGSKLHLRCDRRGRPVAVALTPGERNERTALPELMSLKRSGPGRPKLWPRAVVGDRGYTDKLFRDDLRRRGISAVIPQLKTEKTPRLMDRVLYRERNVVERLVGWLKEYRRIAASTVRGRLCVDTVEKVRFWPSEPNRAAIRRCSDGGRLQTIAGPTTRQIFSTVSARSGHRLAAR
jgi:transposase